jgi:hypothetical protein
MRRKFIPSTYSEPSSGNFDKAYWVAQRSTSTARSKPNNYQWLTRAEQLSIQNAVLEVGIKALLGK